MSSKTETRILQRSDYTFKYNKGLGRHGWLRLTPAYSVKLVKDLISDAPAGASVLDPFSGTGTTGLVAAEHGNSARTLDINPFLIWLGNLKCASYSPAEIEQVRLGVSRVIAASRRSRARSCWVPSIFNIERWWSPGTLIALSVLRAALAAEFGESRVVGPAGLAWVAFCRLVIETSSAAFNHQSMSFHADAPDVDAANVLRLYQAILDGVLASADSVLSGESIVVQMDARDIGPLGMSFDRVVTSPPYPNRMSYIRELRPYMYWTKFLEDARTAGELDWKAVGGTWGIASSRLNEWQPEVQGVPALAFETQARIRDSDGKNAELLATYVLKYFHDMHMHLASLRGVLNPGAELHYVVGNSTFFGVMVDTAAILEASMSSLGYEQQRSSVIRKRNSKKELFEYCVSAKWPG